MMRSTALEPSPDAIRSREPGAGSREPGAGSREPGAGSREPGAGSREPGAGSREPGEPGAGSREPGAGSREPGAGSREPGAGSREPGAGSRDCVRGPGGPFPYRPLPHLLRRAADAMGRAVCARRERPPRLSPGPRRPAGPSSSPCSDTGTSGARVPGRAPGLSGLRRAALAALLGLAAFAAAPQGASAAPCAGDTVSRDAFWSACMTVGVDDGVTSTLTGYRRAAGEGGLSDTTFSIAGSTLRVDALHHFIQKRFGTDRYIKIDFFGDGRYLAPPSVTAGWVLHIGSGTYALDAGIHSRTATANTYRWLNANVSWTEGQQITVSLTKAPEVHSAEVEGTSLVITFDQFLAAAASLANGAFEVKKRPSGGSETTVTLSGSPSIRGATVTLTLDTAVTGTDTGVKVSYTKPDSGSGNKLENLTGHEVVSFTRRSVDNLLRWSGLPVVHVEVEEGSEKSFKWTPPGTPTAESPVTLKLFQWSLDKFVVTRRTATATNTDPVTFRVAATEDGDWEDETAYLWVNRLVDGEFTDRVGYVSVTARDDDRVAPGETNGCAAAPTGNFWSACMEVRGGGRGYEGLRRGNRSYGFGGLSETTVSKGGTHVIDGIVDTSRERGDGGSGLSVSFAADPRPAANSWVVKLGSKSFNFSDAKYYAPPRAGALRVSSSRSYLWSESGLNWPDGRKVTVSLFDIPKPTGVSATPGDRQATLTWTAPSGVTATDYEIRVCRGAVADCPEYVSHGPPPPYWLFSTESATVGGTVTRHAGGVDDTGKLVNGATYTVQVRAVTADGKGGWSDRVQFVPTGMNQVLTPAAPRITGVTAGGLEATLAWEMPEAVAGITGWQVRYGEFNRSTLTVADWGEWADLAGAGADTRSYTVTGLSAGTDYGVELRAMVGALAGTASPTSYISGVLAAVSGLAATPGDGAVGLSWTVPSAADEIAGWQVRWKASDAAAWGAWADIAGSTAATAAHTVTDLDNGTRYAFRVRALATNNEPLAESGTAEAWAGGPPVPGAPALLAEAGDARVALTWTAPESVEPITGWQLRHGATGAAEGETAGEDSEPDWGEWTDIEGATGDTSGHTVTGLENGAEYAFELRALAGALVGEASARRLARPEAVEIPPIDEFFATDVTATAVGLEWTLPEGVAVTRLRAMQRVVEGEWEEAAALSVDATSATVTGLSPGTRYQFRIVLDTATQSTESWIVQQDTLAFDPLDTKMSGSVPEADDGTLREGTSAQGCRVDVGVRFVNADGEAVAVAALVASDFTVENGRGGAPVADDDGLGWTVPVRAATGFTGLLRVRLPATERWAAAEQAFGVASATECAPAARNALASLSLDGLELDPSFDAATTAYAAAAPSDRAEVSVTASAVYGASEVTFAPGDADPDADGHQVALAEGETQVTVTVTPADGDVAAKTWTVTVTRAAGAGVLTGFVLVDASSDADLGAVASGGTVPVSSGGNYGIRAEVEAETEVGSVVLSLAGPGADDTHTQTENLAPYSLYGDAPGGANGRAEHGRALAAGSYTLTATAYAESGGAGDVLGTLTVAFTVAVEAAPVTPPSSGVLTGFVLLDASDQATVAALADGAQVDLDGRSGGSFAIRADVASSPAVGSVVLSLTGAKTVSRTENLAPYSLYGDHRDGNGGRSLDGASLPAGTYTLSATAYAQPRASGTVRGTLSVSFEVLAPAALSVADAEAEEGTDATLDFAVTLNREAAGTVTVGYATENGTATAGSDYTATSGTLTFQPGETEKTVSVPVLEDDHDEGSETLTLRLTSASGATIADGEATGTITNSDAIPQAWLARFGRTVTGQVLDAVQDRLAASRQAGAEMSLAGQALPSWRGGGPAAANDDGAAAAAAEREEAEARAGLASMTAWLAQMEPGSGTDGAGAGTGGLEPQSRALTQRDLIVGTSFALTGGSKEGGGFGSLWGRASIAGFDGREGALTVDGEVTTGLIGADWASAPGLGSGAGNWTAGLALGHSTGTGGWRRGGACDLNCAGAIEAVLSGLYPYAGVTVSERLSVWAAAGYGAGEVTVTPEGAAGLTADLTLSMGAAGLRSEVLRPVNGNGLSLALKGDARFTRTSSDAVRSDTGNLAAAEADVWLLRTGVEGSRPVVLGEGGASLTPSFEVGLRLDGGDAESGMGADLGGGLAFADPANGVSLDMKARGLVAHEASGFREWGASVSGAWDPRPRTGRGLSLSLRQSWGASPSGGMDALLSRETLAGLAANDDGAGRFEASSRLEGELGYGLPAFGGGFTGTPNLGFGLSGHARDWRIGWRLTPARAGAGGFEVSLDATRSEPANDDARPEHGVMLRGAVRW